MFDVLCISELGIRLSIIAIVIGYALLGQWNLKIHFKSKIQKEVKFTC